MPVRDLMGFQSSLSPISSVPSGDSVGHLSSSSSVLLDDSDGDVGLLMSSLGLSSFGSMSRESVSSDFSFYSAIGSPTGLPQAESGTPVPRGVLAWKGPFQSELPNSDIGAFGRGCAFSQYNPQVFGFRSTIREIWAAVTPPPVSRVDWRPGVGSTTG